MNTNDAMQATKLALYEFPWEVDDRHPVVDIALDAVSGVGAPASLALTRADLVAMIEALDEAFDSLSADGGRASSWS
jgi:hypothetical protein